MCSKKNLSQLFSNQSSSGSQEQQVQHKSVFGKWRKFCAAIAQTALLAAPSLLWLEPTVAQPSGPRFLCGSDFYLMQGQNAALFDINRTSTPYTLQSIGGASGIEYNALGYNPVDGYLYAIRNNNAGTIYRISSTGAVTTLGTPTGWQTSWGNFWFSGTFLEDGTYLINNGATNNQKRIVRINVQTLTVVSTTTFSNTYNSIFDIAVNPLDNQIYAYDEANGGRLLRINPSTFAVTEVSTSGQSGVIGRAASSFFDPFGRLFMYGSPPGDTTNFTRFFVADTTTGILTQISSSPSVSRSDGAACTFGLGIEKTVSPTTTPLGSTVTYSYRITNQSDLPVTTSFADDMDDNNNLGTVDANERSYVNGTLVNPFGGTANSYGGTERLEITGLTIPANSTNTITVNVAIPNFPALDGTTLFNQACLNGADSTSIVDFPASLCSDDGDVVLFPNATPLIVNGPAPSNPDLVLVKRITAINGNTTGFTTFQNDPGDPNDTDANWPNGFLVGGITATAVPGDVVDYTIYFLNTGDTTANNVKICDPLSEFLSYIPNSYDGSTPTDGGGTSNLGIELNFNGSSVFMTGAADTPDRGQFVAAGVAPSNCVIEDPSNAGTFIPITAAENDNGTLTVDLSAVDDATGTGVPNTAYGYIRFRSTVD
ncbi:MAG: hypothetical protein WBB82_18160 [Limnothrix sp.]